MVCIVAPYLDVCKLMIIFYVYCSMFYDRYAVLDGVAGNGAG